jgi:hypothetical protein
MTNRYRIINLDIVLTVFRLLTDFVCLTFNQTFTAAIGFSFNFMQNTSLFNSVILATLKNDI